MSPLWSIVRASHCRNTHHRFAVDALPLVGTDSGARLVRLLLRHHGHYLRGATDPDTRFCDYQNHVIHARDGYWGGAPRVAHAWYDRLLRYLRTGKDEYAAHAAGVLSHYFTDVLMPLHTHHSERERVLHGPIQWSIAEAYEHIYDDWKNDDMRIVFHLSDGPGWLGEAMLHAARYANGYFQPLLDTYDLEAAAIDPPTGLGLVARSSLAELFGLAVTGWARVIERAGRDAELLMQRPIPSFSAIAGLSSSTLGLPRAWVAGALERRRNENAFNRLVSELRRTGTVKDNLPAEVDIVHRVVEVHQDELRWQKRREQQLASEQTRIDVLAAEQPNAEATNAAEDDSNEAIKSSEVHRSPPTIPIQNAPRRGTGDAGRLRPTDPLTQFPAMGRSASERFGSIGITTVDQFLAADATTMAESLLTYWMNADTLAAWQRAARLMCQMPILADADAQLLAAAGLGQASDVASRSPSQLHDQLAAVLADPRHQRGLRGVRCPNPDQVHRWIDDASRSAATGPMESRPAAQNWAA